MAKIIMKWEQQINGYWLAQGRRGNFLIWLDGGRWHARYLSTDGQHLVLVPGENNFRLMRSACEASAYWEAA